MRALSGSRVLDLGIITAGAATSAMLVDFGAEVIKVESPSYRDPFRRWASDRPLNASTDLPPFFRATNRGKLGLSLDLKSKQGREVFLAMVANSDIVVENFRRGVMEKLGLGYESLKAANPKIILASISSQGETGPEAPYVSYGSTLEAVAGLAWATGYEDGEPMVSGVDLNYPDQVVALFASSMIVTAWRSRLQGGDGVHLDMSQRELTSYLLGETFAAASIGEDSHRTGNAQAPHLIQECLQSADGRWLAVTVDAEQAVILSELQQSGVESSAAEPAAMLQRWVAARPLDESLKWLRARGIAVAEALNGQQVLQQEGQVWSHALQRSPQGVMVKGFPLQFDHEPLTVRGDAPAIGGDTAYVLRHVAGLSDDAIDALHVAGVIELADSSAKPVTGGV
jgi:crotonobetainyl-CoA:carnitine CoA-transferase CaiB-like acyl-CoA transferase